MVTGREVQRILFPLPATARPRSTVSDEPEGPIRQDGMRRYRNVPPPIHPGTRFIPSCCIRQIIVPSRRSAQIPDPPTARQVPGPVNRVASMVAASTGRGSIWWHPRSHPYLHPPGRGARIPFPGDHVLPSVQSGPTTHKTLQGKRSPDESDGRGDV